MSPSEFDEVLAQHVEASFTSKVHARLRATIAAIEMRGRKATRRNVVVFKNGRFDAAGAARLLGDFFYNYNSVEATLLFA